MHNTQLTELIRTLSADEIAKLKQFVYSKVVEVTQSYQNVLRLMDYFCEIYPKLDDERLEKINVYKHLFPDEIVVEGKIDKLMVDLHKIVKVFFHLNEIINNQNSIKQQIDFLKILEKRNLKDRYVQTLNKLMKNLDKKELLDEDIYMFDYLVKYEFHHYLSGHNSQSSDLNIPQTIEALSLFYFYKIKELYNRYLLQKRLIFIEDNKNIQNILNAKIPDFLLQKSEILRITNEINTILQDPNRELSAFDSVKNLIESNESKFDKNLNIKFATYVRNIYTIYATISSESAILEVLHNIKKNHLSKGYLYYNGKISSSSYVSLAFTAIIQQDLDWANNFIESHKNLIMGYEDNNNNYYSLMKGIYYFAISKFQDCLDVMPDSLIEISYVNMQKKLEIKAYYELEFPLLTYKLDAYKMYISRVINKNLSNDSKSYTVNFMNILIQIINTQKNDQVRAEKIIHRIHEKKFVSEKSWLIAKAKELGGIKD